MRSSRSLSPLVLAVALVLVAPLTSIADTPPHGLEVPIGTPGGPGAQGAGDPNDGSGSGIVSAPPVPLTLPQLVAQLEYRVYQQLVSRSSQTEAAVLRHTPARRRGPARHNGSNRP